MHNKCSYALNGNFCYRNTASGVKSISFQGSVMTMGTGIGTVTFYDLRAQKYLESSMNSNRTVMLKTSRGYVVGYDFFLLS